MAAWHTSTMEDIVRQNRYMLKEALGRADRLLVSMANDAAAHGVPAVERQRQVDAAVAEIVQELVRERDNTDERVKAK